MAKTFLCGILLVWTATKIIQQFTPLDTNKIADEQNIASMRRLLNASPTTTDFRSNITGTMDTTSNIDSIESTFIYTTSSNSNPTEIDSVEVTGNGNGAKMEGTVAESSSTDNNVEWYEFTKSKWWKDWNVEKIIIVIVVVIVIIAAIIVIITLLCKYKRYCQCCKTENETETGGESVSPKDITKKKSNSEFTLIPAASDYDETDIEDLDGSKGTVTGTNNTHVASQQTNDSVSQEFNRILQEWNLQQYADVMVEHECNDPADWTEITDADLTKMGFRIGSRRKFLKKVKTMNCVIDNADDDRKSCSELSNYSDGTSNNNNRRISVDNESMYGPGPAERKEDTTPTGGAGGFPSFNKKNVPKQPGKSNIEKDDDLPPLPPDQNELNDEKDGESEKLIPCNNENDDEERKEDESDYIQLLIKWNMEQYINVMKEYEWTDPAYWHLIKEQDLEKMQFRPGNIRKFLENVKNMNTSFK